MKRIWHWAGATTVSWAALARGQAPPVLPNPSTPPPSDAPSTEAPPPLPGDPPAPADAAPLDQGPDTLPSLEEETTAPLSPPPATVNVVSTGAPRSPSPVRADRRLALLGEVGWNSLAGFGVNVSFHAHPHVTFDLGVGLALIGGKVGLRVRYNFVKAPVTPFIGVGMLAGTGFDAPTRAEEDDNPELNITLRPSAFFQSVAGIDWTSRTGFTMIAAAGYAWRLTGENVEIITGVPTEEEKRGLEIAFGDSIVISIAIGYSFE